MSKDKSTAQGSQEPESQFNDLSDRETILIGRVGKSFVVKCVYYVASDQKVDASVTVHDPRGIDSAITTVRAAVSKLANAS